MTIPEFIAKHDLPCSPSDLEAAARAANRIEDYPQPADYLQLLGLSLDTYLAELIQRDNLLYYLGREAYDELLATEIYEEADNA